MALVSMYLTTRLWLPNITTLKGIIYNNHTGLDRNKGYYEGMDVGEIWGFVADDLFMTECRSRRIPEEQRPFVSLKPSELVAGW